MRLDEPADDGGLLERVRAGAEVDETAVTYIPPLLASLSAQLEAERRRRTDAEQQVALLAAQVARREAELEARLDPARDAEKERITREHALDVLERTLARNRALEADVRVLDAKVKAARVYHHAERYDPPPRSSSLAGSPRRPDRVRSAPPPPPPISPARSIRDVVVLPRPTFGHRQARQQQRSPSPVPRSSSSSRAPSPLPPPRTPSPAQTLPPPPRPRTAPPPPPAVRTLDAHLTVLEDALAAQHRERDRLAVSAPPAPFDPGQFTRTGLLEAECVRLMRRVRQLEMQLAGDEDPDTTVRPQPGPSAPLPLPPAPASGHPSRALASAQLRALLPPIELDPHPRPVVSQQHVEHDGSDTRPHAHPHTIHDARARSPDEQRTHLPDAHDPRLHAEHDTHPPDGARSPNDAEQRMATLAAELARAQDAVAARERAMEALRDEIARLRGVNAG